MDYYLNDEQKKPAHTVLQSSMMITIEKIRCCVFKVLYTWINLMTSLDSLHKKT